MKKILLLIIIILFGYGCSKNRMEEYKEIIAENDHVIIDVRTKEEYEEGHLVDSVNIPYNEITKDINISKDKIVFVYCKSGNRSKIAYNTLTNMGYTVYEGVEVESDENCFQKQSAKIMRRNQRGETFENADFSGHARKFRFFRQTLFAC